MMVHPVYETTDARIIRGSALPWGEATHDENNTTLRWKVVSRIADAQFWKKQAIFMFLVFNCCVHMMKFFEIIDAFVIGFAFVKDSALGSFLTSKIPPHYYFLKWAKSSCGRFCAVPLANHVNHRHWAGTWTIMPGSGYGWWCLYGWVWWGGMVSKLEGEKRLFPATQPLSARSNLSHRLTDIRPLEKEILKACL